MCRLVHENPVLVKVVVREGERKREREMRAIPMNPNKDVIPRDIPWLIYLLSRS